jgi:hypothetical protein
MRVSKVSYGATRSNGNFGNDRVEVEVHLDEGDDPVEAFSRAKRFVDWRLSGRAARAETLRQAKVAAEGELLTLWDEGAGGNF